MRFFKLRIAWTVCWGTLAALLIALWMRSYWVADVLHVPVVREAIVNSGAGSIQASTVSPLFNSGWPPGWGWKSVPVEDFVLLFRNSPRWECNVDTTGTVAVRFPHWLPIVIFATVSAIPWVNKLKWRFSLRTLLIATTIVGLMLGGIVYFSTRPSAAPRFDQGFGR